MKISVASQNPVKLAAAEEGFTLVYPKEVLEVAAVKVDSEVADQPMSSDETLQGAMNRAQNAKEVEPESDFWIGLEGGIEAESGQMLNFAWIIVISKQSGKYGQAKTGSFYLPEKISQLVNQGKELGEADDIIFGGNNSKQKNGAIGLLTGDIITRKDFYVPAVVMALIPHMNPDLY